MPKFFCLDCGKVSQQRRCEIHRNIIKKRKPRSITYRQRKYRKDAVNRHIALNGYICSGYRRRPHFATDLTADHPMPTSKGGDQYQDLVVYCRSCNSSKQATIWTKLVGRNDLICLRNCWELSKNWHKQTQRLQYLWGVGQKCRYIGHADIPMPIILRLV